MTTAVQNRETETVAERREPALPVMTPDADVIETGDSFTIVLDLPGVREGGAEVNLDRNVLTIRARTEWAAPERHEPVYAETVARRFERSFAVTERVDGSGIRATLKNGVLRVRLPKREEARSQRRTIAIESA